MLETGVRSLGGEDPLEKEMATHTSTLAWKILWEELGRLSVHGVTKSQTQLSDFTSSPSSKTEKTFSDTGIHISIYLLIIHSPSSLCQGDVSSSNPPREGCPLPVLHSTTTQHQPGPSSASMFKHSHISAFPLPWPGAPNPQSISPTSFQYRSWSTSQARQTLQSLFPDHIPHNLASLLPQEALSCQSQADSTDIPSLSLLKYLTLGSSPFLIECPFSASEKCFLPVSKLVHYSFLCYIFLPMSLDGSLRHFATFPPPPLPLSVQHFSNWMCIWLPWEFFSRADSDLVGLEWGLRFCISNKLPWEAEAAGPVQRRSEKQDLREQCLPPASNIHPTAPKVTNPTEMLVGCHLRATKLKIQWGLPFWMIAILN